MEIYIINSQAVIDVSLIAADKITLKSYKSKKPSEIRMKLLNKGDLYFNVSEGNKVVFKYKDVNMFTGYIFDIELSSDGFVYITAFDSLRYLKNKDTYIYSGITASTLIKMICSDFGLNIGEIEDTGYSILYRIEDNKSLWDIILNALELTYKATGKEYILYDEGGKINLKSKENMMLNLCADSSGSMIEYSYKTHINSLANSIKIFQTDKATGERLVFTKQDMESRKKYGTLQYTQTIPQKYEEDKEVLLESLLESLNKRAVSFKIRDFGNTSVRGGSGIYVYIKSGNGIISGTKTVSECIHYFGNDLHIMELELE